MISYPTSPIPSYPLNISSEYKNLVSQFETGTEQRRQQWRFPRRTVAVKYDLLTASDVQTLWAFYQGRRGILLPFWFFDTYTVNDDGSAVAHTDEYVGRGDASTLTFDLPGSSTSSRTVYVDSVATGVTYSSGTGDGGADQCTFAVAPALGALITADFTGHLRLRVRYMQDKLSRELFEVLLYRCGSELTEVKFA